MPLPNLTADRPAIKMRLGQPHPAAKRAGLAVLRGSVVRLNHTIVRGPTSIRFSCAPHHPTISLLPRNQDAYPQSTPPASVPSTTRAHDPPPALTLVPKPARSFLHCSGPHRKLQAVFYGELASVRQNFPESASCSRSREGDYGIRGDARRRNAKRRRPGKPCVAGRKARKRGKEGGRRGWALQLREVMRVAGKDGTCHAVTANSTFELFTETPNCSSLSRAHPPD